MRQHYIFVLLFSGVVLFMITFFSCSSSTGNKHEETEIEEPLYEHFLDVEKKGVSYKIPSPFELFIFLKKFDTPFLDDKMSDVSKTGNYITKKTESINFGVYSADLAYCSVYGDFQQALNYYNSAKKLADRLGLHEMFGQDMANRVNNNLNNVDSLIELSADFNEIGNQYLEEQGQSDVLALVMVGSWIEGLYLTVESAKVMKMDNPVVERIADQQILLENLMSFLNENSENINIKEVINDLQPLQEAFDDLYFNNENTLITKKQFVNISNEVIALRNKFVNI